MPSGNNPGGNIQNQNDAPTRKAEGGDQQKRQAPGLNQQQSGAGEQDSSGAQQQQTPKQGSQQVQKKLPGKDEGPKKKFNPRLIFISLLAILAIAGIVLFQYYRNKPEGRKGWLRVNGGIEGYEVNVGAKIAGRVEMISNREGEEVRLGQPLVRLSDEDIQAQLRGAKAKYEESLESVHEAEELVKVSKEQVEQAKLNVTQARQDADGRIEEAAANVATKSEP